MTGTAAAAARRVARPRAVARKREPPVNLCWPRPATAAGPPGSCLRGRWSPRAGPRPAVDLQLIAVTPEPGSSSPAGPSSSPKHPVRSGHQRTTASVTAPLSCIISPRWATRGYFPSPRGALQAGSRLGRHRPLHHRQHEHADAQVEQTAVDRSGGCDCFGRSGCAVSMPAPRDPSSPMPRSSPTRVRRASCQGNLLSTKASCQWYGGDAGRNAAGRIIALSG